MSWFRTGPLSEFSDDDLSQAALDLVWPITPPMFGYWGDTLEKCDREQAAVDQKRVKFADYEPERMRKAIMRWLDFCDNRIKEARHDIESGTSVRRMQKYEEKQERKRNVTNKVRDALRAGTK